MRNSRLPVFTLVYALILTGCVPDVEPGHFACDPDTPGSCPPGQRCLANGVLHECHPPQPDLCGDGIQDLGEECDGRDIPGDCSAYGLTEGNLSCTTTCEALCTACGNGAVEQGPFGEGETCDDGNQTRRDGCSSNCQLEELTWTKLPLSSGPSPRAHHALVYDDQREKVVLFGGVSGELTAGNALADTWEFDGTSWLQVVTQHSPPARFKHSLAYDAGRERVVLVGGTTDDTTGQSDTWEYDGLDWTVVAPTQPIQERFAAAAAYDPVRARVVVFGGTHLGVNRQGTWEYDGQTWVDTEPNPRPGARVHPTLVWAPSQDGLLLSGGSRTLSITMSFDDTWLYREGAWQQISTATNLPARDSHAAFFDPFRDRVVVAGGIRQPEEELLGDLMEFDGSTWREVTHLASDPLPPRAAPGVYVLHVEGALLFGGLTEDSGNTGTGETWWLQYGEPESVCGDGLRQGDEICDGDDIADPDFPLDCVSLGHGGGVLTCAEDCTLDQSGCTD